MRNLFLIILLLNVIVLSGCGSEYNFGIAATSEEYLKDVEVRFLPSGRLDSTFLNRKNGMWLRYERHWPVPRMVKVCFRDPEDEKHELQADLALPADFSGDIVIVIHKEREGYQLKKFVGKLRELDMDSLLEKF